MKSLVKLFKALSDETRINILMLVSKKNMCQKGISRYLNISDSAVSQHIKVLKESGILIGIKDGYYVLYYINEDILKKGLIFIKSLVDENDEELFNINNLYINNLTCTLNCKSEKKCCMRKG